MEHFIICDNEQLMKKGLMADQRLVVSDVILDCKISKLFLSFLCVKPCLDSRVNNLQIDKTFPDHIGGRRLIVERYKDRVSFFLFLKNF